MGIGIGLALDEERSLVISNLIPGSPALRSGLLEIGDALRHVDGRDVRGMSPEQARVFPDVLGERDTPRTSLSESLSGRGACEACPYCMTFDSVGAIPN